MKWFVRFASLTFIIGLWVIVASHIQEGAISGKPGSRHLREVLMESTHGIQTTSLGEPVVVDKGVALSASSAVVFRYQSAITQVTGNLMRAGWTPTETRLVRTKMLCKWPLVFKIVGPDEAATETSYLLVASWGTYSADCGKR